MKRLGNLAIVAVVAAACASPAATAVQSHTAAPPLGSAHAPVPATPATSPTLVTPVPEGTPGADAVRATALLDRYQQALVAGDWQAAWDLLAPQVRAARGSFADYVSERKAFFASAGRAYSLTAPEHDGKVLAQWVPPASDMGADLDRAYVIEVDYPALAAANGYEVFLVAPTKGGTWAVWAGLR